MDDDQEKLTERIVVPATRSLVDRIDEYWHANRLKSKSEAVRRLIEVGLDATGAERRKKRS
jgi:hypothetical protein